MELRHLRTFVAVAEQGTVSKASARLGVAQPALSRQIQDLESDLGVRLFDRIRRRLVLTSAGEQLLADCRSVLGAVGAFRRGHPEGGGDAANNRWCFIEVLVLLPQAASTRHTSC